MKKFWTYIKHKRKDIVGISSLKMDGKLYCDPVTKSNILNRLSKDFIFGCCVVVEFIRFEIRNSSVV
jgi:hypothetical protein